MRSGAHTHSHSPPSKAKTDIRPHPCNQNYCGFPQPPHFPLSIALSAYHDWMITSNTFITLTLWSFFTGNGLHWESAIDIDARGLMSGIWREGWNNDPNKVKHSSFFCFLLSAEALLDVEYLYDIIQDENCSKMCRYCSWAWYAVPLSFERIGADQT